MKRVAIGIFAVVLIVGMGLVLVCFEVRETESALVMRFGKAVREITEAGLHIKWPIPIERVHKFDSRMRVFEPELGETTTKGAVPIIVNTYVVWRIDKPLDFYNANKGIIEEAEKKLRSQINDTRNRVIGLHSFGEFVNSDESKIRFASIEDEMTRGLSDSVSDANYGIAVETVGIKQLNVSEDVSKDVFGRMRAERNSETQKIISQGLALATRIRTDADSKKTELLATAEARATAIRARGDAEAAKYYELLREDPEFAIFLSNVKALEKILEKRTTYVVPTDIEPLRLLREIPKIEPRK